MVKFRALSVRPGLEYTSWSSRRYPSCCRVALSIRELLSDGVLVVSSWYLGSLLKKGSNFFGETALRWRAMSLEVFSLTSGIAVSLQRSYCGVDIPYL